MVQLKREREAVEEKRTGRRKEKQARKRKTSTSYYICVKCIYIRQYHVIVSPKVVQNFFEKDAD